MTPAFERRDDAIRMQLRAEELALLRRLRDELEELLHGDVDLDDPIRARLFPPAVVGDDEADVELRGLMHDDLLQARLEGLEELVALLDRAEVHRTLHVVDLVDEEPPLVLGVLNDLRLALGARVGLQSVEHRELAVEPGAQATIALMDWIAMWQEQLLVALDPASARHYDEGHDDPDE